MMTSSGPSAPLCIPGQIIVASRRSPLAAIARKYPGCEVVDVTSKAEEPWRRFSPFYPHGNIPIPFSHPQVGASVEGIWQGLKVFEREDIDVAKFSITTMKSLKRSSRGLGHVLGHRKGTHGAELLSYPEARAEIYIPSYRHVLQTNLSSLAEQLKEIATTGGLVLLDYETNTDVSDTRRPLSHAGLVREHLLSYVSVFALKTRFEQL